MSLEKIINGIKKAKSSLKGLAYSAVIGAASLGFLAGNAKAGNPRYKIEKIPIPDPNANFIMATGINEDGEVVGVYGKKDSQGQEFWRKAFLYKSEVVRDLGESACYRNPAINDLGEVVVSKEYSYPGKSSIYTLGQTTEISFWGEDINNKGEVVGGNWLYSGGQTIKLYLRGEGSELNSINDYNQIVGTYSGARGPHAFLWENGIQSDLPSPFCAALDINNNGKIVGYIDSMPDTYSCLWEKDVMDKWVVRQLDTSNSRANAINDKGQIVGSEISLNWPRNPTRAILYEIRNGELIKTNLNDFLLENAEWERLVCALDINDKGQIVGYSEMRNEPGSQYAFLMTPKPKPSADLNEDGIVNLRDLSELANYWLEER
jgi:probable HAF family extracellular repeat protein